MTSMLPARPRLLIFIVAYNAERTIAGTLRRIPPSLTDSFDVEVLVIDDASRDRTFEVGRQVRRESFPFKLTVLFNPVNQGYGGNQKIGFHYAIEHGFDFVALLHGDGQYAPESLPDLIAPLATGQADAVLGSRMLTRDGALRGGMPIYKFVGNRILTFLQNRLLGASLSEFHSGYRVYSVGSLRRIPFHLNSNVFHFDTEIIIQLLVAKQRIIELPIPTYYGDEICHVNGVRYAVDVLVASVRARVQGMGLLFDPKFDCQAGDRNNHQYAPKLSYHSTHRRAIDRIPERSRVLDLGCAGGYVGHELRKKHCHVTGIDVFPLVDGIELDVFHQHDLNQIDRLPVDVAPFDYVLLLDVIEHLRSPEQFVAHLKLASAFAPDLQFIVSTGNVGFIVTRLMLLAGQLNYGKRGILDLTHTRLFTFSSFRRLFEQAGFDVVESEGIPAPFPLALGDTQFARFLIVVHRALISIRRSLFAYQMLLVVRPRPSLIYLLQQAWSSSMERAQAQDSSPEGTMVASLGG